MANIHFKCKNTECGKANIITNVVELDDEDEPLAYECGHCETVHLVDIKITIAEESEHGR